MFHRLLAVLKREDSCWMWGAEVSGGFGGCRSGSPVLGVWVGGMDCWMFNVAGGYR